MFFFWKNKPKHNPVDQKILKEIKERVEKNRSDDLKFFAITGEPPHIEIDENGNWIVIPKETFSEMLLRLINESGKKPSYIYKKAGLTRQHFNKIKQDRNYQPKKETAIALAFALNLPSHEFKDLIKKAGYSLSDWMAFDIAISYCIEHNIYNLIDVNDILYALGEDLL